jgi:hypothetical protein
MRNISELFMPKSLVTLFITIGSVSFYLNNMERHSRVIVKNCNNLLEKMKVKKNIKVTFKTQYDMEERKKVSRLTGEQET